MAGGFANAKHLHFPLLTLSIALLVYALATPDWPCGNLVTQCFKTIPMWVVLILLIAGTSGLGLIFLIDVFGMCNSKWIPGAVCETFKMLVLIVSATAALVGNLLYTYWKLPHWSYTISVIGSVVATQVVFLAILDCRCLRSR
ncbi:hypothetical protein CRM22_004354 [Opisthorchis felineus]|uniref:MARVEL domain-containing protein n=1 Tax=Opisthorchis felineus TaxID=147828 RepID=A0A4S2LWL0_OPIFE|nr:hypothetical protein CRM22_004354 [Opisthorchis felineus]TGZ68252.1 hypothetical protein CRM22_004354 [Opisthorchis felineus]TGZ68253.1 hypothetical protein CRM22_004354 [Opisthorchis felineus]TGZ68254.1 hypothetical protein CRM22_004354 [Opisthorchis felineus]